MAKVSLIKSVTPIPNGHNMQLTLNPIAAKHIVPLFEIEILRGDMEELPDGQTRYTFTVSPAKMQKFKKVIHQLMGFDPLETQKQ